MVVKVHLHKEKQSFNLGKPTQQCLTELEEASCLLYGKAKCKSINKARLEKFEEAFQIKVNKKGEAKVKGIAEARIPMPLCVLLPHMRRAFREAYVQKMALFSTPAIPQPTECGYKWSSGKELEIEWVEGSAFPAFISKVDETEKTTDNSTRSGDEELSDDELGEEFHNESDDESEYSYDEFSSSSDEE